MSVLLQIQDTASKKLVDPTDPTLFNNWFFWISVAEFLVIIFLILKYRNKKKFDFDRSSEELIVGSKNINVSMNDLMNNINKSGDLYDRLKTKCHPDRFIDTELNRRANEIFQEITKNKRNYNRLLEMKALAENELNVTI